MLTRSGNRDALSRDCASVHTLKTVLCLWTPPKADERRTCVQCFRLHCLSCNLRVEHPQGQYNATLHLSEQTTSGRGLGVCGLNILAEAPPPLWDGRFALGSELRTLQPRPWSEEVNIDGTLVAEDGCGIIVTSFLGTLWTTVSDGSFQSLQVVIRSLSARSLARSGWVYSRFTRHATTDEVGTLQQFIVRGIRESSHSYLASRSAMEERL